MEHQRLSRGGAELLPKLYFPGRDPANFASDLLPLCDIVCLFLAAWAGTMLFSHWSTLLHLAPGSYRDAALEAPAAMVLAPFILYDKHFGAAASRGQSALLARSFGLRFVMLVGVMLALGAAGHALGEATRLWLLLWIVIALLLTSLTRALAAQQVRRLRRKGALAEVIAIVGAGPVASRLADVLRRTHPDGIALLGVYDDEAAPSEHGADKPAGTIAQLIELGRTRRIDWIVLTLPPTATQRLNATVQRLKVLSVPIGLCPQDIGLSTLHSAIDVVGDGVPVSVLADRPIKQWSAVVKTGEDLVLGSLLTLLLLPVLAVIAIAVKLGSPGPVLFKQRRHRLDNREFDVYKFRTMRSDTATDGIPLRQTARDDPRVTRVGRWLRQSSLDELPQLFNVLKGDMSLVGPRPHAIDMRTSDRLGHEITDLYVQRHRIKPGITGWSQVNGARGATVTTEQLRRRVELDLHYIDHWSLLLDLKILALTSLVVLKRTNAY